MQQISGAQVVIKALQEEKVDYIFGYPGGSVLHIYDELSKQKGIRHILVRHEQAAAHAADAYSRSTDKVGVCLVTSGPGVTNAVTGIATAYMDSIPMVIISGQVPTAYIGQDAFQEVDTIGITRPCVKHNFLVKDVTKLAEVVRKAFYIAKSGRPGPVLVDIPKDVSAQKCVYRCPYDLSIRSYKPLIKGHQGQVKRAIKLIQSARRPLIYAGGGVILSNASGELAKLVRLLKVPITQTLMGLGGFPGTDYQNLGMLGMHGTYEANMAMQNCDVLIAVGARFDDRVIGNPEHFASVKRKIIHIDIDPSSISKRVSADIPIVGLVNEILGQFLQEFEKSGFESNGEGLLGLENWWAKIKEWRDRDALKYEQGNKLIMPQYVVEKVYEITKGDAFVCSDVGQHQMWAAQYYPFDKPRRWINSGGLGTMGFGLPAAMGVQFAFPKETVVCITGEGSIQMCIQELSTARQFNLPIKIISLNNRYLGMVRQWQEMFHDNRYAESYMDSLPDFVQLAKAYGHVGIRIERPADVEDALKEAFVTHKNELVFMDIVTNQKANVYPMVAAGKGLSEMILGQE